jgi:predicted ArsR family transcriptional regulator
MSTSCILDTAPAHSLQYLLSLTAVGAADSTTQPRCENQGSLRARQQAHARARTGTAGRALGIQARRQAGGRRGRETQLRAVQDILTDRGYQPRSAEGGSLALANCPFHALAQAHRTLMCGVNLDLIDSLVQAAGPDDIRAELSPSPGMCCVRITRG